MGDKHREQKVYGPFLPVKEAARHLGISERKIWYLLNERKLAQLKHDGGKRVSIPMSELDRYAEQHMVTALQEDE